MAAHHTVPRFHLSRWTNPDGLLEVLDLRDMAVRDEEPKRFSTIQDFNRIEGPNGEADPWLEHDFLGSLDSDIANLMPQIEGVPSPKSLRRNARQRDWHETHILSPKDSARLAMYLGAQAVRIPAWREALKQHTADEMRRTVDDRVRRELASATDPRRISELNRLVGFRLMVAEISGNQVPHLSGHLAYRLGEVFYREFAWATVSFPHNVVMLGDDPVGLLSIRNPSMNGSYSQVAGACDEALSIYRAPEVTANRAVEVLRDIDLVTLPLDPRRVLLLSRATHLLRPGRYDADVGMAIALNRAMRHACSRWICLPPGSREEAREAIDQEFPWRRWVRDQQGSSAGREVDATTG